MKIFCVGRNYSDHAKELGNAVPSKPLIFMKPSTALTSDDKPFFIPEWTENVHYEAEIVLKIKKNGKYIHPDFYQDYFDQVCLGIDFTARDIQDQCKAKGHPWELAKAFDNSALISEFIPYDQFLTNGGQFSLEQNNKIVQEGNISQMLFDFKTIIVYISKYFTLQMGDLIFTGTPAGVGKVNSGDLLKGNLNDVNVFNCHIK